MNKLYTIDEIAELIGVHRNTVLTWIKDKKLQTTKFGDRTIRITQLQLDEFVKESGTDGK